MLSVPRYNLHRGLHASTYQFYDLSALIQELLSYQSLGQREKFCRQPTQRVAPRKISGRPAFYYGIRKADVRMTLSWQPGRLLLRACEGV